jgi:hypothetical protein
MVLKERMGDCVEGCHSSCRQCEPFLAPLDDRKYKNEIQEPGTSNWGEVAWGGQYPMFDVRP